MLLIHAPLVLENLLPEKCAFELLDSRTKTLLWRAEFKAGQAIPVHDVRLTYGLLLVIQTDYCRSPEGALIHRGDVSGGGGGGVLNAAGGGDHSSDVARSLTLLDNYNHKITVELEHHVGGAGQRRVTVYCPYWLVNHTDCMLIYRQEGKSTYPAGTISEVVEAEQGPLAASVGPIEGEGDGHFVPPLNPPMPQHKRLVRQSSAPRRTREVREKGG